LLEADRKRALSLEEEEELDHCLIRFPSSISHYPSSISTQ